MRRTTQLVILLAGLATACSTDDPTENNVGIDDAATSNTTDMRSGANDQGRGATEMGMRGRDQGNGDDQGSQIDIGSTADSGSAADSGVGADMGTSADMGFCPDQYEPNNVVAEATPVNAGDTIQAVNCGFDDDDIYAIDLNAGDEITLVHSFTNAGGNLDLNLHAPSQMNDVSKNGPYAAITFSFDDVETITHVAEETGTYYILSFNNNETNNPYTLAISVQ